MRLLTAISIASLVVSIAAVVFVLGLYAELKSTHPMGHSKIGITMKEKSEPDTPLVKKEHAQELSGDMVDLMIIHHVEELFELAGITKDNASEMVEVYKALPGYGCFWHWSYNKGNPSGLVLTIGPHDFVTHNYIKEDDVWLLTSYGFGLSCKKEITTWAIDDNTGEVTYGHPDEK
jgi:hypothetical protein